MLMALVFRIFYWRLALAPITSHIKYKILLQVSKSQLGLAPNICDFMNKPLSSTSVHPLCSSDNFVLHVRTTLVQCRASAVTGPSTWNGLSSPLLCGQLSGISTTASRSLKTPFLFPLGFCTESCSE